MICNALPCSLCFAWSAQGSETSFQQTCHLGNNHLHALQYLDLALRGSPAREDWHGYGLLCRAKVRFDQNKYGEGLSDIDDALECDLSCDLRSRILFE